MHFIVSERVLKEITRCAHKFSCHGPSQCGDEQVCLVDHANGQNDVIFVNKTCPASCPYSLQFGKRQSCICPTLFAIHMKHIH
jgi:hypothetical protein